jgi:hypothetical protein
MKIFKHVPAAHDQGDLGEILAAAELGMRIEQHLLDPRNPFSMFLDRAREEFIAATLSLLDADLATSAGIEQARSLQAKAQRYQTMCAWISDAMEERESAVQAIDGEEEEEAVEQLKDQIYGIRAKPAPDV